MKNSDPTIDTSPLLCSRVLKMLFPNIWKWSELLCLCSYTALNLNDDCCNTSKPLTAFDFMSSLH